MTECSIDSLIIDLDEYTGFTKHELVDEAVARREEIIPRLLAILQKILDDPEQWLEEDHDIGPYALILLAYFQEPRAHRLILDLFSLPGRLPDDLFGDLIGETLPTLLIRTCGGSLEGIKELILNRRADGFCRWSACRALGYAVVKGLAERAAVLRFLSSLLKKDEAPEDSFFWTGVVDTLIDLHPGDVLEAIFAAYEAGLVEESFATLGEIRSQAAMDQEAVLAELAKNMAEHASENVHDYMAWWDEPGKRKAKEPDGPTRKERRKKEQRKKKKKMTRKSRRRNR
jgi:hypothetical protein